MSNVASTPVKTKTVAPAPTGSAPAPARSGGLWPMQDFPRFLTRMQEEFNQLFDRFHLDWPSPWGGQFPGRKWRWGVDVQNQDHAYVVRAEAPGFEAGDFDLQVTGNQLELKATRKTEVKGKKGEPEEFQEQEYYQFLTLPGGIDREMAVAEYKNGILTVTLPKTEEGKSKKLAVKNG